MKLKSLMFLAALALTASADAALLKFDITGTFVNGTAYDATFFIDESPVVDPANAADELYFFLTDIAFAGSPSGFAAIQFFNADNSGGGIAIVDNADYFSTLFDGTDLKQYYEGSELAPHFLTGTYTDLIGLGNSRDSGLFTLTISEVAPVPEPATWAMMIGGLAFVGATLRRRTSTVRFA